MAFRLRSIVDVHRGRVGRARETLLPLIAHAERAGRTWWEALLLSALAFVEFADGNHAEVDRVLTRMGERTDSIGVRDFLPDRSEPFHVESLVALGELERARERSLGWRIGGVCSRGCGLPSGFRGRAPSCWRPRGT